MLKIEAAKKMFFDRAAVINATDRATKSVFSKFGAFVRRVARSSIRRRKKSSAPGMPPSSHTDLLKKFIFFGYDAEKKSVVIGPVLLNGTSGTAPEVLEKGGTAVITQSSTARLKREKKTIVIKKRPYMQPAFEKVKPQLPAMWANSIK